MLFSIRRFVEYIVQGKKKNIKRVHLLSALPAITEHQSTSITVAKVKNGVTENKRSSKHIY